MTAWLRDAPAPLIAALAAGAIRYRADLMTITLIDGTVLRWTNFDHDLTYDGHVFTSQGVLLNRMTWSVKNTLEVPNFTLKASSLNTGFNGGAALQVQIHGGLLDGAAFLGQRAMMGLDARPDTLGVLSLFAGKVAGVDLDGLTAAIGIKGKTNDLDQYAPRNLYQIPCNHAFCDAGCTLSQSAFTAAYSVGASPSPTFIPWSSAPVNASGHQGGVIAFTSGAAAGSRRTIVAASSAGVSLAYPLPFVPAPGDGFTALRGCDKTYNSGSNQSCTAYGNTAHYRGFPDTPPPGSAY